MCLKMAYNAREVADVIFLMSGYLTIVRSFQAV